MPRAKAKAAAAPTEQPGHALPPATAAWAAILDAAQSNYATHTTCRRKAEALLTADTDTALHSLTALVGHALTAWHKHAPTERTLAFISSLASSLSTPHLRALYFHRLLSHLQPLLHASDKAVRLRSVQLIGQLLREREKQEDGLSEEMYQRVREAVMERAEDKQPAIRAAACSALEMLQETAEAEADEEDDIDEVPETPEDDDDDDDNEQPRHGLTDEQRAAKAEEAHQAAVDADRQRYPTCHFLLDIAASDSSPLVRRCALTALHIPSPLVRSLFLARLHDSSPAIRRLLYGEVGRRLRWDELTVDDRAAIVDGLGEKEGDAGARKACAELVQQWAKLHDGDLVRLLGRLYVEVYPQQAGVLVRYMMEQGWPASEVGRATPLPPYSPEQLSAESALYWAAMCEHAAASSAAPLSLDALLPGVDQLCAAVEIHEHNPAVLRHLLAIARLLPLRADSDRQQLRRWMQRLLASVGDGQAAGCVDVEAREAAALDAARVLRRACAGDEQLLQSAVHDVVLQLSRAGAEGDAAGLDIFSAEYGQQVDEAATRQQQLAEQLQALQAEWQQASEAGQPETVSRAKQQMRQLRYELAELTASSQQFVAHCLYHTQAVLVVSAALSLLSSPLPPPLEQLYTASILVPATELSLPGVAGVALRALGRYCLLSREWALRLLPSFAQMLQQAAAAADEPREEVAVVMRCVTDILVVHRDVAGSWSEEDLSELVACLFAHCADYRDVGEAYTERQAALHLAALECVCKLLLYDCIPPASATALALLRDLLLRPTNQRLTSPQCALPTFTRLAADSLRIVGGFLSLYARSDRPGGAYPHSSALLSALMLGARYVAYAESEAGQREERLHPPLRQVAEGWAANVVLHVAHTDATPAHARQQASEDVQALLAWEVVAYVAAFPHSRCLRALLAVLEHAQPRRGQVSWLCERLQRAAEAASEKGAEALVERLVKRWAEAAVQEAEQGWEARRDEWDAGLDERREEWLQLDVQYGGYERSHREQRSFDQPTRTRKGRNARRDSSDEEQASEEDDEEVADAVGELTLADSDDESERGDSRARQRLRLSQQVEQTPSRRPVRQSRAVAEDRMAREKVKQRAQDALIEAEEKAEGPRTTRKRSKRPVKQVMAEDEEEELEQLEDEVEEQAFDADKENSGREVNQPVAASSLSALPIKAKRAQQ